MRTPICSKSLNGFLLPLKRRPTFSYKSGSSICLPLGLTHHLPGHTRLLQCIRQTALPHAEVPCSVLAVPLPGLPSPRAPPADPSSGFSSSGTPSQARRLGEDSAIPSAKHTRDSLFNSLSLLLDLKVHEKTETSPWTPSSQSRAKSRPSINI